MGKYEALAKDIVANVGGKENVISVINCITRLRFKLRDEKKANTDVLKNMDGVVTVMQSGGQYQVVIGNHVPEVRADVDAVLGVLDTSPADSAQKGNLFDQFVELISGIFQPILAPLAAAGMIKGVNAILSFALGQSFQASATYAVFNAMGDGLFLFLPIFIGYTSMKKFNGSPFVGMMIAAALVYPGFVDGTVAKTFAESGGLSLFGIPFSVPTAGYGSSVMPIIAITAFAAFLEHQLKKIIPDVVKLFLTPFFTAIISIPLGFLVIGPVMNLASDALGKGLLALQGFNPIIFGLVLGFAWQVLVMFGLHWAIVPFAIIALAKGEPTALLIAASVASFAQTGAVGAVMLKTKDKRLRELAIPAFISGWFGVTEPAIYGITLPKKRPFWVSCIVSGILSAVAMVLGIKAYTMGALGIFSFTSNITLTGEVSGAIKMMIVSAVAVIAGFVVTYLVGFEDDVIENPIPDKKFNKQKTNKEIIGSPLEGKVIPLSQVKDAAFSAGVMGKGAAIEPTLGEVRAPFDGMVMILFPTKHAIGLISNEGTELLIHIGIDTVQLEGKYFETFVKQGQSVKKGDLLLKFDIERIQNAGYSTQVPIIVTNTQDYMDILVTNQSTIHQNEVLLTAVNAQTTELVANPV
ncbi:beta-glucoside-specific PTS transporter subunit IIABC [Lactococcus lactis]|uniref:beta-glucoside-specific PTS transporter subunit IIABC n=1 Tax=Lactococcus lactis TaxID=1358 RepID=UPI0003B882C0|nr:beta-glucoside-specific PTS transporter subunit IIABC [Lactococcus lactis]MCT0076561.1 PTS beta-glucoside transporter subunit EIIBCA [Lactococcus lactis subsp. lactis]MDH5113520.1 beta-glucoside-specific PTS transporter subunit IIABC [Lactococcus lactis]MDM7657890.1 beta-glucoside-specific PTS transporter subunit IIABC [Lactococcus lactis]QLF89627.1 PTS glucose transporter subunit IIA [Lactococcus lactis subsp. lactis]UPS10693.1 PTS system beta-glucoside-specific EIIBCA component [Lactococc